MVIFEMDEEDVKTVISHPLSMICSDSWAMSPAAGGDHAQGRTGLSRGHKEVR
jgi:hypothetical protein